MGAANGRHVQPLASPGRWSCVHRPSFGVLNQLPFDTLMVCQFQLPPMSGSRFMATMQWVAPAPLRVLTVSSLLVLSTWHWYVLGVEVLPYTTFHPRHEGARHALQHAVNTCVRLVPMTVALTLFPAMHVPLVYDCTAPYWQTRGKVSSDVGVGCTDSREETTDDGAAVAGSADPSDMMPTLRLLRSQKHVTCPSPPCDPFRPGGGQNGGTTHVCEHT